MLADDTSFIDLLHLYAEYYYFHGVFKKNGASNIGGRSKSLLIIQGLICSIIPSTTFPRKEPVRHICDRISF